MNVWRAAAIALAFVLAACDSGKESIYQGWVDGEVIFVGPDESGRIETLSVREGDMVTVGAPLFTLDADLQQADVAQNQATLTNARQALERAQQLLKTHAGTQATYDNAEAAVRTAEARLNSAQTRLLRRKVFSPVAGPVQQIYFRRGEMVSAGRPVVAILPPANVKLRFFVAETVLAKIALGETVTVRCDACGGDLKAKVSFIARSAEYTPPVIYSLEERSKLVFLVEARPEQPEKFRIGQPISVVLPTVTPEAKK